MTDSKKGLQKVLLQISHLRFADYLQS